MRRDYTMELLKKEQERLQKEKQALIDAGNFDVQELHALTNQLIHIDRAISSMLKTQTKYE